MLAVTQSHLPKTPPLVIIFGHLSSTLVSIHHISMAE